MPAPPIRIASRANARVKQLRAAFAGHLRLADGLVAIEGETLLSEALHAGVAIQTVFLREDRPAPAWLPPSIERIALTADVFASAVDTQSPQGIAALLAPPAWSLDAAFRPRRTPLLLIAAGLQDPGNLGTLIRSAQAFAASAVFATPGTVSEWNGKALRASAGAVFRMPVVSATLAEVAGLTLRGVHLFAAVAGSAALPLAEANLSQPCALLIGNEGAGLSAELLELADTRITIPTPGHIESLNAAVAGSLLLYEACRQRSASGQAG